jgi:predicted ATP-dependent protease
MRDLLSEANYWAGKNRHKLIQVEDIEQAIEKQEHRQDRYRELMQEQVLRGIKMIDTDGARIAQVNALSVLQTGRYRFGQASRITATARLGRAGVVDIEREAKLGGEIHSKGVMILSSYLAHHYAANQPLPLAASLAFEQSYGTVDGEKIEGFFEVCASRGLTGEQGVIIPAANQVHLMLRKNVREAVANGEFSIYPVQRVSGVMQLLSGMPPGNLDGKGQYPKQSFNYRIQQRIEQLQQSQKKFMQRASENESTPSRENDA